jgi:hypothetical protein
MARKNKKETLGNYIIKIGYMDIYQKFNNDRKGKAQSSDYRIVHAKHVLKGNIKSLAKAKEIAKEFMRDGVKYNKYNKS